MRNHVDQIIAQNLSRPPPRIADHRRRSGRFPRVLAEPAARDLHCFEAPNAARVSRFSSPIKATNASAALRLSSTTRTRLLAVHIIAPPRPRARSLVLYARHNAFDPNCAKTLRSLRLATVSTRKATCHVRSYLVQPDRPRMGGTDPARPRPRHREVLSSCAVHLQGWICSVRVHRLYCERTAPVGTPSRSVPWTQDARPGDSLSRTASTLLAKSSPGYPIPMQNSRKS
jgi:hypothetical protein